MKKILFGATALLLLGACSGLDSSKIGNQDTDSLIGTKTENVNADTEQDQLDSLHQGTIAKEEKKAEKSDAKYDSMLDKYDSLIKKCWSMSKKGLSINDQVLADIWMEAGEVGSKLDKQKKNLTVEQQKRLKKLNKDYRKFCMTQPA